MWTESTKQWYGTKIHALTWILAYGWFLVTSASLMVPTSGPAVANYDVPGVGVPTWRGAESILEGISSGQAQKIARNILAWAKCRFPAKRLSVPSAAPADGPISPRFLAILPLFGPRYPCSVKMGPLRELFHHPGCVSPELAKIAKFRSRNGFLHLTARNQKSAFFSPLILISGPSPFCWCVEIWPKWGGAAL